MNVDEIRQTLDEFRPVLAFCDNIRTGLISLTLSEYQNLPNYVVPVWNIYLKVFQEISNAKRSDVHV